MNLLTALALLAVQPAAAARPARSTTVVLANRTGETLVLRSATLEHGRWAAGPPPPTLAPGGSLTLTSEEAGPFTGIVGELAYGLGGASSDASTVPPLVIRWENPFFGHNRYALHGPAGLTLTQLAGEGNRTVVQLQVLPLGVTPVCNGDWAIGELRRTRNAALEGIDMAIAAATTPVKEAGISGWVETGCRVSGVGRLVRDAQPSTDGYLTVDVALVSLDAGGVEAPSHGRYLRLEVPPGTAASVWAHANPLHRHDVIAFEGPLRVDTDGPWLECHPEPAMRRTDDVTRERWALRVRPR